MAAFTQVANIARLRRTRPIEAEALARRLHEQHPSDPAALVVWVAILGDLGQFRRAAELVEELAAFGPDRYIAATITRALRNAGRQGGARLAAELWTECEADPTSHLAEGLLVHLRAVLRQDRAACGPVVDLDSIDGAHVADGVVLRVIRSRRQLSRAAHYLHNCLGTYWPHVRDGRVLIIVVERGGDPIEALEVDPASGAVGQWLGIRNCRPAPSTQGAAWRVLRAAGCRGHDGASAVRAFVPALAPTEEPF